MRICLNFIVFCLFIALPAYADVTPSMPTMGQTPDPATTATPAVEPVAPADGTLSSVVQAGTSTPAPVLATSLPVAPPAPTYIKPTLADLLRTLVRFNALDLQDDHLIDEYAEATDCEIYKYFFKDDFKWNEIRKKMRTSAKLNMDNYPVHFYIFAGVQLDRYDFERKIYRFTDKSAIHNVNLFTLYSHQGSLCDKPAIEYIPKIYQAVSDVPFNLLGLPLTQADAQTLLRQMNADKNTDHTIIVRFDMTVTYVDRLIKQMSNSSSKNKEVSYSQMQLIGGKTQKAFRMDVHLDSVSFYEDYDMKKLVYSTKP